MNIPSITEAITAKIGSTDRSSRRLGVVLLPLLASSFLLTQCETVPMPLGANIPTGGGTPNTSFFLSGGDQAQGSAESPVHTPEHNLPRHEYPFDDKGRYREEWVTAPSSTMSSAPRSSSAERTGSSISFNRRSTMQFHIVQPGDSIWTISRRYDVSHIKLQELNRLAGEPQPGDTLRIP